MSTNNLCFEQKYEKYQFSLSESFQFFEVKFSTYLNRRVFVIRPLFRKSLVVLGCKQQVRKSVSLVEKGRKFTKFIQSIKCHSPFNPFLSEDLQRVIGKQFRPRSDAAECGI